MKKSYKFLILFFGVSLFAVAGANAQNAKMYIKAPLSPPKEAPRSPRPNKFEVWVPGEWGYDNVSKYVYRPGYWAFPPMSKSVYLPGHWEKADKGYHYIPGYWKNPR